MAEQSMLNMENIELLQSKSKRRRPDSRVKLEPQFVDISREDVRLEDILSLVDKSV